MNKIGLPLTIKYMNNFWQLKRLFNKWRKRFHKPKIKLMINFRWCSLKCSRWLRKVTWTLEEWTWLSTWKPRRNEIPLLSLRLEQSQQFRQPVWLTGPHSPLKFLNLKTKLSKDKRPCLLWTKLCILREFQLMKQVKKFYKVARLLIMRLFQEKTQIIFNLYLVFATKKTRKTWKI